MVFSLGSIIWWSFQWRILFGGLFSGEYYLMIFSVSGIIWSFQWRVSFGVFSVESIIGSLFSGEYHLVYV